MHGFRRNLLISFAQRYTGLVVAFASTLILARLLTPAETGLFSVAVAITAIAHVFRDFGVGAYIVQEPELTPDRIRAAYSLTLASSWILAILLYAGAGWAAGFFDEAQMQPLLELMALVFVLVPLNAPVFSVLQREMKFASLFVINTASNVVHAIVAVALAFQGFSAMSLAWAAVAGVATQVVFTLFYRPKDFPVLPGFREIRRVIGFGSQLSISSLASNLGVSLSEMIVGKLLGFAALGLYSRAQGLVAIFNRDIMSAVTSVVLPAFAAQRRQAGDLAAPFLQGTSYVTVIGLPFFAFLGLMALPAIRLLYGSQWLEAVPILQILAVALAIGTCRNLTLQVLTAMGQARRIMVSEIVLQTVRLLLTLVAAFHSILAVAGAQILVHVLALAIFTWQTQQAVPFGLAVFARVLGKSLAVTALSAIGPLLVALSPSSLPDIVALGLAACGAFAGWLFGVFVCNHPIRAEITNIYERLSPALGLGKA